MYVLTSVVVTLEDERKRKVGFLNPDVMVVVYSYLDNIINSTFLFYESVIGLQLHIFLKIISNIAYYRPTTSTTT